jgi:hypothetical protein
MMLWSSTPLSAVLLAISCCSCFDTVRSDVDADPDAVDNRLLKT